MTSHALLDGLCARYRQHVHALRIALKKQSGVILEGSIYEQLYRIHQARELGLITLQVTFMTSGQISDNAAQMLLCDVGRDSPTCRLEHVLVPEAVLTAQPPRRKVDSFVP